MPASKRNSRVINRNRGSQRGVALELEMQNVARRSLSYEPLGRLYMLETEAGVIHFTSQRGPGIARFGDGRLLFISEWPALPDLQEYSTEFCPACLADCDICEGSGKALCQAAGCGVNGAAPGQRITGHKPCHHKGAERGIVSKTCCDCRGTNVLPVFEACAICEGSGRSDCGACRGTGKRPTGNADGSRERDAENCASCRGTLRAGQWNPQKMEQFLEGRAGDFLALSPVRNLLIQPANAKPGGSYLKVFAYPNEKGIPLMVLLPAARPNGIPYFYGGDVA